MTRRIKQGEYNLFVDWYAAWPDIRKKEKLAKTQKQLAQELGVSEVILSKWQNKGTFEEDVKWARIKWGRSLTSEMIYALYLKGTGQSKGGNVKAVELWMDLVESDWDKRMT